MSLIKLTEMSIWMLMLKEKDKSLSISSALFFLH
ncbi:unnamed protein product [Musa acuminata subsp. malaccensis]|uniref:(wild Malaysian banana) hypothetical protein n=1 Tax=Musa acuminata subsp. malaccensis TaxID=214687 RepID=A0A804IA17_MUSAM|nr:unnamed protein product [Musa acuminata subsp. malaccensis]